MRKILAFTLFLQSGIAFCQTFTTSNLPIVVLNTGGAIINDEPKVEITMGIIDNPSGVNNVTDPWNGYNGAIGIEFRGNSTQGFDKKTYSIELHTSTGADTSVTLLGMPREEDWILHAMVIDKTQLRMPMSFYLSQRMGHYASRYRYVEVVLDGDYRGVYILTEKLKRDKNRVDIAKLDSDDLAGDSLTGGYVLRIDWLDNPQGFESNMNAQGGNPMFFQWYYPKASNILPAQSAYIKGYMDVFEEALFSATYINTVGIRYDHYIDLTSFVDFLLINEFSKNSDGYKLSSYLHKDKESKGGKLVAGPIWDFDQTYGLSTVCSSHDYTGWTYLQNQIDCEDLESMPMWWQRFMSDTLFANHLACRWQAMRQGPMHLDSITLWIDNQRAVMQTAIDRNFIKWQFLGSQIWIEPFPIPQDYQEEIDYMKDWIANRLVWLDANMPGNCQYDVIASTYPLQSSVLALQLYPNPMGDEAVIDFDNPHGKPFELHIYDMMGRESYVRKGIKKGRVQISRGTMSAGLYVLQIKNGSEVGWIKLLVR